MFHRDIHHKTPAVRKTGETTSCDDSTSCCLVLKTEIVMKIKLASSIDGPLNNQETKKMKRRKLKCKSLNNNLEEEEQEK